MSPAMGSGSGDARRSGDPRKRAAASRGPDTSRRQRLLGVSVLIAVVLVAFAVWALRDGGHEPDAQALAHAESACDLTSKAHEAARAETDARYAATVLVLDRAIVESARAAEADPTFADLDQALQAVHTAAHTGDPAKYDAAMETAEEVCRATFS